MQHTGATILRTLLERQGIHTLAGIPGGAILPFYDALHGSSIRHILTRHEQGAGFVAQGMARTTGRAAVCLATSGPGATNLLTAIADARLDSIPLVAITAQVPQAMIGTDAFQEVDTYGLTLPITKHNFLVRSIDELLETVPLAFRIAESGRPGPVAIDIPKDVLTACATVSAWPEPGRREPTPPCAETEIEALANLLAQAQRPMLYLGGGVIAAGAAELARALAQRLDAPSVTTLMALGTLEADDPLNMGMLGMHGGKGTNLLMREADVIFAIGARFDDRATGKVAEFCPQARIAHLDIDRAEIGKIRTATLALAGDAADALTRLLRRLPQQRRSSWRARAVELRDAHPLRHPPREAEPLHPVNLCRFLGDTLPADSIVTTDVGQHQMWVAQAFPFRRPRALLTSGGLGTMGFGLPAAIGASLAAPGRRVVCVSGDGSILMNIQELATLAELDLPVAVLVCNNAHLGLVRQQQELFYGQRYSASRFLASPDFAAIARGFGVRGITLDPDGDPLRQLAAALDEPGPCVVDIPIRETVNVLPMVPPGAANHLTITETESTLAHA
ncbi:MAG TPA: biosynthetic-type acetolactate synthase large subunit [Opitutaceae bacterium]|nr:biosynthetic-type acetolactate synthase large subunit [Opitutaceae bacterium]